MSWRGNEKIPLRREFTVGDVTVKLGPSDCFTVELGGQFFSRCNFPDGLELGQLMKIGGHLAQQLGKLRHEQNVVLEKTATELMVGCLVTSSGSAFPAVPRGG